MEDKRPRVSHLAVDGENVGFYYNRRKKELTLDNLNIKVERGIIYGLLGPSGCGKTTLLRCIVGRYKPHHGTIKIYGKVPGQKGILVPGPGVGFMPQELALYPEITTKETLFYFGKLYQMKDSEILERTNFLAELLDLPNITKQVKNLSGGQQRRVSFAVALIHKPPLLILDEPTVGVDPLLRQNIWKHLVNLAQTEHLTIMVTTHYVEEARKAHVVGLMRNGHLLAERNPETLIRQHGVRSLEDVFLKLCTKDSEELRNVGNGKEMVMVEKSEDVWILKDDEERENYDVESGLNNTENHKASLLSGINEVVSERSFLEECRASVSRTRALINKNLLRLFRDILLLGFQLFIPTFQVITFCLCVGGEPFDLSMAIVNQELDPAGLGIKYLDMVDKRVIHQVPYANLSDAMDSVKAGHNWGVLHIGPTFSDSLVNRYLDGIYANNETIEASTIWMYLDTTNQQISYTIQWKFLLTFQDFAKSVLMEYDRNPNIAKVPVMMGDPIYGEKFPNFMEFMAPGTILTITYIMAVSLSAISIIIEKKEGLLDRSFVAGVRSWEVMFSILFTLFLVLVMQAVLVLICTFVVFDIPYRGPIVWVVVAVLLAGLEGMCFGFLVSAICKDETTAVIFGMGSIYPNLVLSGIVWPVEALPYYLRQITYFLPLTMISKSLRSVLSRGLDITQNNTYEGYLIPFLWIVPIILLTSFLFKN